MKVTVPWALDMVSSEPSLRLLRQVHTLRFAQPFVCAVLRRNENLTILLRVHGTMMFAPVSLSSAYIAMEEVLILSILTCCAVKKKKIGTSQQYPAFKVVVKVAFKKSQFLPY